MTSQLCTVLRAHLSLTWTTLSTVTVPTRIVASKARATTASRAILQRRADAAAAVQCSTAVREQ